MDMRWYMAQPSRNIRSLEHRKEMGGIFKHEFIVLRLDGEAICRLERMGDPDARFDAITPQGTTAYDLIESFQQGKLSDAHLGTSEVLAKVEFPKEVDLLLVLLACRAIHEGENTCKYTLQTFNCYFFALAIQSTLTRLHADWVKTSNYVWETAAKDAASTLKETLPTLFQTHRPQLERSSLLSVIDPLAARCLQILEEELTGVLDDSTLGDELRVSMQNTLWYSTLDSAVDDVIEGRVREAMVRALRRYTGVASGPSSPTDVTDGPTATISSTVQGFSSGIDHALDAPATLFKHALVALVSTAAEAHKLQKAKRIEWLKQNVVSNPVLPRKGINRLALRPKPHPGATATTAPQVEINSERESQKIPAWRMWWSYANFLTVWACYAIANFFWTTSQACRYFVHRHRHPAIDKELLSVLVKLGEVGDPSSQQFYVAIDRINALSAKKEPLWETWPWTDIYEPIKRCILGELVVPDSNVLTVKISVSHYRFRYVYYDGHKLNASLEQRPATELTPTIDTMPELQSEKMSVSAFQEYLLRRINLQAELVQAARLGSAQLIREELEAKLSEVWAMLRLDASDEEDGLNGPKLQLFESAPMVGYK